MTVIGPVGVAVAVEDVDVPVSDGLDELPEIELVTDELVNTVDPLVGVVAKLLLLLVELEIVLFSA